jgi:hypothetical protein
MTNIAPNVMRAGMPELFPIRRENQLRFHGAFRKKEETF